MPGRTATTPLAGGLLEFPFLIPSQRKVNFHDGILGIALQGFLILTYRVGVSANARKRRPQVAANRNRIWLQLDQLLVQRDRAGYIPVFIGADRLLVEPIRGLPERHAKFAGHHGNRQNSRNKDGKRDYEIWFYDGLPET